MFSVQASPFNSGGRQLYGGWKPGEAKDLWSRLAWHRASAKFNPDADQRKASAAYLKDWAAYYKKLSAANQKAIRDTHFRNYRQLFKRDPLTDAQRKLLWGYFEGLPVPKTTQGYGAYRAIMGATYPPPGLLQEYPGLFRPMDAKAPTYDFDHVPLDTIPYETWKEHAKARLHGKTPDQIAKKQADRIARLQTLWAELEEPPEAFEILNQQ